MLCGNHSSNLDPIVMSIGLGMHVHPHYMAKIELFRIPLVSQVIRAIGTIQVDREKKDIASIKTAMRYLKAGRRWAYFRREPGTQRRRGKPSAVRFRSLTRCPSPSFPLHHPEKASFRGMPGRDRKAVFCQSRTQEADREDYNNLAEALMAKIAALRPESERR
jgi:1-acyl-sn-glycerol-3-phosphate acyltransferase